MSLLLHSQLQELLGTSVGVEQLQLVSLLVEGGYLIFFFFFSWDKSFYAKPDLT